MDSTLSRKTHRFPTTQYHGSKRRLVPWILEHTPKCKSVLDAFSGSGVVAYAYKQAGKRVVACEFLTSSYQFVKATVENNRVTLSVEEIEHLLESSPHRQRYIENHYAGILYPDEECRFLDNLYANIQALEDPYKRSLAMAAAVRTCVYKMPGGKFRPNLLAYRDPNHRYYKPKFRRDMRDIYRSFLNAYNQAVFDNGQENTALNANILDVIGDIQADVAYFDPPYGGSSYDYIRDYFFVELYARYYGQIHQFSGAVRRYEETRQNRFRSADEVYSSLEILFERATHIPYWVVSYNNRSRPSEAELLAMLHRYKFHCEVISQEYAYKSGKNRRLRECLFICYDT